MEDYEWVEAKPPSPKPVIKGPSMPPPEFFEQLKEKKNENWLGSSDFDDLLSVKPVKSHAVNRELAEETMQLLKSRELNNSIVHEKDGTVREIYSSEEDCVDLLTEEEPAMKKSMNKNECNKIAARLIRAQLAGNKEEERNFTKELNASRDEGFYSNHRRKPVHKRPFQASLKQLVSAAKVMENEYKAGTMDLLRMSTMPDWSKTQRFVGESGNSKRVKVSEPCKICDTLSGETNTARIVWSDDYVCLLVDGHCSLVNHQCFISTKEHVSSSLSASTTEFSHCQRLMWKLVDTFKKHQLECVFVEYSKRVGSGHTRIECYPLSPKKYSLAPMHFKKAILDSEGDWTDNRKVIEYRFPDFRKTVTSKLPFFAVSFGAERSFAHIIENQSEYPAHFAKEILAGLLGLERHEWRTKYCSDLDDKCKLLKNLMC